VSATNYTFGTNAQTGISGDRAWTDPSNVLIDDSSYATTTIGSGQSEYLYVWDFGFSIPSGATIDGVEVRLWRYAAAANVVYDSDVRLIDKSAAVALDWLIGNDGSLAGYWPTSDQYATHGGASDTWGLDSSTLNESLVNSSDFGFAVSVDEDPGNSTAYVTRVQVRIHYTAGCEGQVTEWKSPSTTANSQPFYFKQWSDTDNVKTKDANYAHVTPSGSPTHYLLCTNYSFGIPSGAKIVGIEMRMSRKAAIADLVQDYDIRLVDTSLSGTWDAILIARNRAQGGYTYWSTTQETVTYGDCDDYWDWEEPGDPHYVPWEPTPTQVNLSTFGCGICILDSLPSEARVYWVEMRIWYQENTLQADCGTYTLSGQDNELSGPATVTLDSGTYHLIGRDGSFTRDNALLGEAGSYSYDGQSATPREGSTCLWWPCVCPTCQGCTPGTVPTSISVTLTNVRVLYCSGCGDLDGEYIIDRISGCVFEGTFTGYLLDGYGCNDVEVYIRAEIRSGGTTNLQWDVDIEFSNPSYGTSYHQWLGDIPGAIGEYKDCTSSVSLSHFTSSTSAGPCFLSATLSDVDIADAS